MKFNIHISENDFIYFNQFHMLHSKDGRKVIRVASLTVPVISILAMIAMYALDGSKMLLITEGIALGLLSLLCFFGTKKLILKSVSKAAVKMKRQGSLPYTSDTTVEFGEESIVEATGDNEFIAKYSDLRTVYFLDEYIFIYLETNKALILPLHCLDGSADELISFLEDRTGRSVIRESFKM